MHWFFNHHVGIWKHLRNKVTYFFKLECCWCWCDLVVGVWKLGCVCLRALSSLYHYAGSALSFFFLSKP
jgi:hypothetical protein